MIYDTILNIWTESNVQPIPVTSNTGMFVLIQTKANDNWFVGKVMAQNGDFYMMDSTMILINGSEPIWCAL